MTVSTQEIQNIKLQIDLIKELKTETERKIGRVIDEFREQTGISPCYLNLGCYSLDGKVNMGVNISI